MKVSKLLLTLILITGAFQAIARKPAVEDFVGVETETYKETPLGTEVSFNFGNHVTDSLNQNFFSQNGLSIGVTLGFLTLPFLAWLGLASFKSKEVFTAEVVEEETPTMEAENVTSLEDYREADESNKKAS